MLILHCADCLSRSHATGDYLPATIIWYVLLETNRSNSPTASYLILVLFWNPHSVEGGLEAVITPVLQGISNVDGDGACHRITRLPQPRLHGLFGCGALPSTHL